MSPCPSRLFVLTRRGYVHATTPHPVHSDRRGLGSNRHGRTSAALPLRPHSISKDTASSAHSGTTLRWQMQQSNHDTASGDERPSVAASGLPERPADGDMWRSQRNPQKETAPRIFNSVYCKKPAPDRSISLGTGQTGRQTARTDHPSGRFQGRMRSQSRYLGDELHEDRLRALRHPTQRPPPVPRSLKRSSRRHRRWCRV